MQSEEQVVSTLMKPFLNQTADLPSQGIGDCVYLLDSIYQALYYAAQNKSEKINGILQAMNALGYMDKKYILSKTDCNGENIPMIAYKNNHDYAKPLLEAVNGLKEKDKNSILSQKNTKNQSVNSLISDNEDRLYFLNNRTNSPSLLSSHSHFSGSAPQPSSSTDDSEANVTPKNPN